MTLTVQDELVEFSALCRAYLEWHGETGSMGVPRGNRAVPANAPVNVPVPVNVPGFCLPESLTESSNESRHDASPPEAAVQATVHATVHATVQKPGTFTGTGTFTGGEDAAARLPFLQSEVAGCTRCDLAKTRTHTVFARGNPLAALCFIGEAPGADEDAQGIPFVGRAGQLLDKMITAMGLSPADDVYVCNIIKCRPPENRRPTPDEIATCSPYFREQIALIKPKVIVALGNTAVSGLLGQSVGITKIRGEWKLYNGSILMMPTYHPSYLLRPGPHQAVAKREAWHDLQKVMQELKIGP